MRLIDADAFCAHLREISARQHYETLLTNEYKYPTVADVIEAVCCELDGTGLRGFDNAPTVELRDVFNEGYFAGKQVVKDTLTEKPHGKWVGINEYINHLEEETGERYKVVSHLYDNSIFCNHCWSMNGVKSPYCPNCGAELMRTTGTISRAGFRLRNIVRI